MPYLTVQDLSSKNLKVKPGGIWAYFLYFSYGIKKHRFVSQIMGEQVFGFRVLSQIMVRPVAG